MSMHTASRNQRADIVAAAAVQAAESTLASLRVLISEQAIRGIIEREAKVAMQAVLLAQAEEAQVSAPSVASLPAADPNRPQPVGYRLNEVAGLLGIGRSKLYKIIGSGDLKARNLHGLTFILYSDLEAFLQALPITKGSK